MTLENTSMKNFIAIPDIISLLNMSSGFLAIIFAINENLVISSSLIILAVMFDSVDGWVARKTNRKDELEFGKNIDSLSDIISFSIAPAIFIYKSINATSNLLNLSSIIVCLLIVICGVLRLTRYNVIANKTKTKDFVGFPIPGIAIIIATFYLSGLFNTYIVLILSILISLLMISDVKYPKFSNTMLLYMCFICSTLLIFQIPIKIYTINIPAIIVLFCCLYYLLINVIKH